MPERKYYLAKNIKYSILAVLGGLLIIGFMLGMGQLYLKGGYPADSIYTAGIMSFFGFIVSVFFIWNLAFKFHVALTDSYLKGTKLIRYKYLFHYAGWGKWSRGKLSYSEIGAVSEGKLGGLKFRRYHSKKNPNIYIIVLYDIDNGKQCFEFIDQHIKVGAL